MLHDKFEELYNEAAIHIDELAERLLALEGKPVGTLKESLELASIKEAKGNEEADGMVQAVVDDFTVMIKELREGIELSAKTGDETTVICCLRSSKFGKHNWMLGAFLEE